MLAGHLMRVGDVTRLRSNSWQPMWKEEDVLTMRASPYFEAVDSMRGRSKFVRTKWPTWLVAKIVSIP